MILSTAPQVLAFAALACANAATQDPSPWRVDSGTSLAAKAQLSDATAAGRIAELLGIRASMLRLVEAREDCGPSLEMLLLRQSLTDAVLAASLDAQSVLAEIDHERSQILELRTKLSGSRDRKINLLTLANIATGTGSGIAATALQFSERTANIGNSIGIIGGAAGVLFSILALRQNGEAGSLGVAPNMLAPLFDHRSESRSVYPASVWAYLNSAPYADPRIKISWRAELLEGWARVGKIDRPATPAANQKIDQLTSRISENRKLSIDLLSDRSAMLADLRARVSLMNADLRDVMKDILRHAPCSPSRGPG